MNPIEGHPNETLIRFFCECGQSAGTLGRWLDGGGLWIHFRERVQGEEHWDETRRTAETYDRIVNNEQLFTIVDPRTPAGRGRIRAIYHPPSQYLSWFCACTRLLVPPTSDVVDKLDRYNGKPQKLVLIGSGWKVTRSDIRKSARERRAGA